MSMAFVVNAQEKLFKDAIKRGLTSNATYCVVNDKKKIVTLEEMESYARKMGYEVIRSSTVEIAKFGEKYTIIKELEFIDKNQDQTDYIFCSLRSPNTSFRHISSIKQLKAKGTAFCNYDHGQAINPIYLERFDNVAWSGSVVNGLLHGKGIGYCQKSRGPGPYLKWESTFVNVCIEGTFSYGIPVGDVILTTVYKGAMNTVRRKVETKPMTLVETVGNELKNDSKFIEASNLLAKEQYNENAKIMEKAYQQALTVNETNYMNFKINNDLEKLVQVYKRAGYDPNGILPKFEEIANLHAVLDALKIHFRDHYYGSLPLIGFTWRNDLYDKHKGPLDNAKRIVSEGKANSKCGFKTFYSQIEDEVNKKHKDFMEYTAYDYKLYEAEVARRERGAQQVRQEMCDNCKIDGSKTVIPEGYSEGSSFLFWSVPAQSKKEGVIYLKNGMKTTWKWVYEDYKTYVSTDGFISGKFDTVDEMIDKIVQTCKSQFCR